MVMKLIGYGAVGLAALTMAAALLIRSGALDTPTREHVDPLAAAPPDRPNWALALPAGLDAAAAATIETPVYAGDPVALLNIFDDAVLALPRVRRVADEPLAKTYVQRSALIGYPDYVSVRAVALGPGRASLAIYSRSVYGYSDWGVNAARVGRWLALLDARAAPAAANAGES